MDGNRELRTRPQGHASHLFSSTRSRYKLVLFCFVCSCLVTDRPAGADVFVQVVVQSSSLSYWCSCLLSIVPTVEVFELINSFTRQCFSPFGWNVLMTLYLMLFQIAKLLNRKLAWCLSTEFSHLTVEWLLWD